VAIAIVASVYAASHGMVIEPPAALTRSTEAFKDWIERRAGALMRPAQ
jgi:hypothetical protein